MLTVNQMTNEKVCVIFVDGRISANDLLTLISVFTNAVRDSGGILVCDDGEIDVLQNPRFDPVHFRAKHWANWPLYVEVELSESKCADSNILFVQGILNLLHSNQLAAVCTGFLEET